MSGRRPAHVDAEHYRIRLRAAEIVMANLRRQALTYKLQASRLLNDPEDFARNVDVETLRGDDGSLDLVKFGRAIDELRVRRPDLFRDPPREIGSGVSGGV